MKYLLEYNEGRGCFRQNLPSEDGLGVSFPIGEDGFEPISVIGEDLACDKDFLLMLNKLVQKRASLREVRLVLTVFLLIP